MSSTRNSLVRFGVFEANLATGELRKNGRTVKLQPQPFKLLALFLERPGELVIREQIHRKLWGEANFVDFEQGLNFAVKKLREALGDDSSRPHYIETIPRRGYRFIAPLERAEGAPIIPGAPAPATQPQSSIISVSDGFNLPVDGLQPGKAYPAAIAEAVPPDFDIPTAPGPPNGRMPPGVEVPQSRARVSRRLTAIAALLAVTAVLVAAWLKWRRAGSPPELIERQLTANPPEDYVARSAISSDGKYVTYVDQTGVYLRWIESGETRALSVPRELRGRIWGIRWFPEGGKLLAVATSSEGTDLWVITVLGQTAPRLLYRHGESPAFSPNGRLIAFVSGKFGKREREVLIGDISGGTTRKLVIEQENQSVYSPVWSPDGRWVAYVRRWKTAQGSLTSTIEVRPADGGPAKALLSDSGLPKSSSFDCQTLCFGWLADWRLVFPVSEAAEPPTTDARHGLWAIRVEPQKGKAAGNPEPLIQTGIFVPRDLTVTADGSRLSFRKELTWEDVYLGELGPDGAGMKLPRRFTLDNRGSYTNCWARDSQAIFFSSSRNGKLEIFRQALKETVPEAVMEGPGAYYGGIVSPDGSLLLYRESPAATLSARPSPVRLMRWPIDGGSPEPVLEEPGYAQWDFNCPAKPGSSCVLREKERKDYVFYSLDPLRGKGRQLGRVEVSYGTGWNVSSDGSRLALVDPHKYHGRIEVLSLQDHSWQELLAEPGWGDFQSIAWAMDGKGFFVTSWLPDSFNLLHVTLRGDVNPLLRSGHVQWMVNPTPSPDGKWLAFQAQTWDSNIWMLQGF